MQGRTVVAPHTVLNADNGLVLQVQTMFKIRGTDSKHLVKGK